MADQLYLAGYSRLAIPGGEGGRGGWGGRARTAGVSQFPTGHTQKIPPEKNKSSRVLVRSKKAIRKSKNQIQQFMKNQFYDQTKLIFDT